MRSIMATLVLAGCVLCSAQETNFNPKGCDPTGTWYGGSNASTPFHVTITPLAGGRYSFRAQQAIALTNYGILGVTDWTGTLNRSSARRFEGNAMAFFVLPAETDDAPPVIELDAVHSVFEFSEDCSKMMNTIDAFIVYLPWTDDKVPFVTVPDYSFFEEGQTLVETYYRLPEGCKNCPTLGSMNPGKTPVNRKFPGRKAP